MGLADRRIGELHRLIAGGHSVDEAVAILVGTAYLISRSITGPLKQTVAFARDMAKGNFRNQLEIRNRDELGQMAEALNQMTLSLREMMKEIIQGIDSINGSSADLSTISEQLSQGSGETSDRSNAVEKAAGNMNERMQSIASAMTQSANNAQMVASAAEEMSSTIGEIAQNAEKARRISNEAAGQASVTAAGMNALGQAAHEIGKVIDTITDISDIWRPASRRRCPVCTMRRVTYPGAVLR